MFSTCTLSAKYQNTAMHVVSPIKDLKKKKVQPSPEKIKMYWIIHYDVDDPCHLVLIFNTRDTCRSNLPWIRISKRKKSLSFFLYVRPIINYVNLEIYKSRVFILINYVNLEKKISRKKISRFSEVTLQFFFARLISRFFSRFTFLEIYVLSYTKISRFSLFKNLEIFCLFLFASRAEVQLSSSLIWNKIILINNLEARAELNFSSSLYYYYFQMRLELNFNSSLHYNYSKMRLELNFSSARASIIISFKWGSSWTEVQLEPQLLLVSNEARAELQLSSSIYYY